MTREEAIEIIKIARAEVEWEYPMDYAAAFDKAVEALEQESCEDTVNRQSVFDINFKQIILTTANPAEMIRQKVKALPPATPKRKVGEWIKKNNDYFDWYECSECGYGSDGEMKYNRLCDVRTKFCPKCGTQMLEVENEIN